ncbi:GntR family transcriptional regulator [Telmatobacter bradus]|uniref:GntR family transcriptional regulator n=1 Tax=Telmatobacter bradus TaxID=474953 RepID=UPI003B43AEAC
MPVTGTKTKRPKAAKAEHGTSVDSAFLRIRDLIVQGRMAPGMWIVEGDLCEHLNLSRTPVRGALYLLQREGYIIEHRNGSKARMVVAPLTREDAFELYPLIARIEGLAGRRAAERSKAERTLLVTPLRKINEELSRIASDQSMQNTNIFDLDHEFHRLIVDAGSGQRLNALHRAIEPQTERYWRLYASSITNQLSYSVKEHEEIIAALDAGDADRLEAALRANWELGCQRLASVIEIFGERGSW